MWINFQIRHRLFDFEENICLYHCFIIIYSYAFCNFYTEDYTVPDIDCNHNILTRNIVIFFFFITYSCTWKHHRVRSERSIVNNPLTVVIVRYCQQFICFPNCCIFSYCISGIYINSKNTLLLSFLCIISITTENCANKI